MGDYGIIRAHTADTHHVRFFIPAWSRKDEIGLRFSAFFHINTVHQRVLFIRQLNDGIKDKPLLKINMLFFKKKKINNVKLWLGQGQAHFRSFLTDDQSVSMSRATRHDVCGVNGVKCRTCQRFLALHPVRTAVNEAAHHLRLLPHWSERRPVIKTPVNLPTQVAREESPLPPTHLRLIHTGDRASFSWNPNLDLVFFQW